MLFKLDKEKLEEYCGPKEGARLASQITVQRNVSGVSEGWLVSSYNHDGKKGI